MEAWQGGHDTEESASGGRVWLAPGLAVIAILLWTALFVWSRAAELIDGAAPSLVTGWIAEWSVPVLLVLAIWLLAMRYSRKEETRFAAAARALGQESALLEQRLERISRELVVAREAIAAQGGDLDALGREAVDRLGEHSARLQQLIHGNLQQVEAVSLASTAASDNVKRLHEDLPALARAAQDAAGQIAQASGVAQQHLVDLSSSVAALSEAEQASGQQIAELRQHVAVALGELGAQADRLGDLSEHRFTELAERGAALRAELEAQEAEALETLRRRADALGAELAGTRQEFDATEKAAVKALANWLATLRERATQVLEQIRANETAAGEAREAAIAAFDQRMQEAVERISELDSRAMAEADSRLQTLAQDAARLDEVIAERQQAQLASLAELSQREQDLAHRFEDLAGQLEQLVQQGTNAQDHLDQTAALLATRLGEGRGLLDHNSEAVRRLTEDSMRLLQSIEASASHSREALPLALSEAHKQLTVFDAEARALREVVVDIAGHGSGLASSLQTARSDGTATLAQLATLEERLDAITCRAAELAEHARADLDDAIATFEQVSGEVVGKLRQDQSGAVRALAEQVAAEGAAALGEALHVKLTEALAELSQATAQAGEVGRAASEELRQRMAEVEAITAGLEQRVAQARAQAEERVDEDFARRMSQITESLNSASIDVSRVLASDISDTAWESYLRGDRGIFTRQAVRLLDRRDARSVAQLHAEDEEFRHAVNRYIGDFEAMLRDLLATREGHRLGVTLLSSDAGKLYVALAQAIERLRN